MLALNNKSSELALTIIPSNMNEENKNIKTIETLTYKALLFTGGNGRRHYEK